MFLLSQPSQVTTFGHIFPFVTKKAVLQSAVPISWHPAPHRGPVWSEALQRWPVQLSASAIAKIQHPGHHLYFRPNGNSKFLRAALD